MKRYIELFKEYWANKRIRALIILGFYFIFFTIVIISFGGSSDTAPKENNSFNFLEVKNYSFNLTINDTEKKSVAVYNGNSSLDSEFDFLTNKFIVDLRSRGTLLESKNNYTEGYVESKYNILNGKVISLIPTNSDITLTIREEDNKIEKVIIEFSEPFKEITKLELDYIW